MRLSTPFITAALAVAVSAHPTKQATALPICKRDIKIWSFGNFFRSLVRQSWGCPCRHLYRNSEEHPRRLRGELKIRSSGSWEDLQAVEPFSCLRCSIYRSGDKDVGYEEEAYDCFVNHMKFWTSGLSYNVNLRVARAILGRFTRGTLWEPKVGKRGRCHVSTFHYFIRSFIAG